MGGCRGGLNDLSGFQLLSALRSVFCLESSALGHLHLCYLSRTEHYIRGISEKKSEIFFPCQNGKKTLKGVTESS